MFKKKSKAKILLQRPTPFGEISVLDDGQNRWFTYGTNYIQTKINLSAPEKPQLKYIPALTMLLSNSPSHVLLLGCGAGGVLHYINQHFPLTDIKGVEINPVLAEIARDYFFVDAPMTIACAFDFIKTCRPYDHILLDVFSASDFPLSLYDDEFFDLCVEKAKQSLSINLIYKPETLALSTYDKIQHRFKSHTLTLGIRNTNNLVLHGFKEKGYLDKATYLYEKGFIKKPFWDSQFGMYAESLI